MKVLCLYQFFTTGKTPGSMRPYRLCRLLAEKGHEVTVVTTDFNFASGEIEGPEREEIQTSGRPITIHRIPSSRDFRKSLFHRLRTYVGFAVKSLWKGLWVSKEVDIVLTSIQPIFVGPIGWAVAAFRGVPFFLEVRDIWPDALEVKGAVQNRFLLRILHGLANFLYRRACHIVTLTPGIGEELLKKGIPRAKIDLLPNGLDPDLFPTVNLGREETRREYGWDNRFVAVYVGVHTEVTSMHTIVEAADLLRGHENIAFEIFGSGTTTPVLERMISERGLSNCRLNGTVSKGQVPSLLAGADVCLMALFESPLIHIYFQNKFFDYMGAGKPIVAALRGDQRTIMEAEGMGICVDPFDSKGMADAILNLSRDPALCRAMGQKGREFAMRYFCLDDLLERYVSLLSECAQGRFPVAHRKESSDAQGFLVGYGKLEY